MNLSDIPILCNLVEHPRLKGRRILIQPVLNNIIPELLVDLLIFTGNTNAVDSAEFPALKALAVHLKTLRFLTLAGKLVGVAVPEALGAREEHYGLKDHHGFQFVPRISIIVDEFWLLFLGRAHKKSLVAARNCRSCMKEVLALKQLLGRFKTISHYPMEGGVENCLSFLKNVKTIFFGLWTLILFFKRNRLFRF